MTTDTLSLADWLLSCIAEDETGVHFHGGKPWSCDEVGGAVWVKPELVGDDGLIARATVHGTAEFIARHDPARVLAECEAHRRIVERWLDAHALAEVPGVDPEEAFGLRSAALVLATIYADRPGYREEWR